MFRVVRMFRMLGVRRVVGMIGAGRALAGRRFGRGVRIHDNAATPRDVRGLASVAQLTEGANFIVSVHTCSLRREAVPPVGIRRQRRWLVGDASPARPKLGIRPNLRWHYANVKSPKSVRSLDSARTSP